MDRLPALRVRMADLMRVRDEYETAGQRHLTSYIAHLIADADAEIAALEGQAEPFTAQQASDTNLRSGTPD